MKSLKLFIVLCFTLFGLAISKSVPEYIHTCKRSDPDVTKCIRDSVEILRPRLKSGIPELDVPGLEPLPIEKVTIFNGDGPSQFKAFLKNVKVYGASDFEITKLKINIEKHTYRVGVNFPVLKIEGEYDVDVKLLLVPIKGSGHFYGNATDCKGQGVLQGEIEEKDGFRRMIFTNFDFAITIGDYSIHLDNLFNQDPILSQAANEVLNSNKQELIIAAMPFIQKKAAEILLDIANKVTDGLNYDEVFPEK